ncbi:ABC-2 type transport system permease protein [Luteibacter sp. UNCMF331Sha3.1]|uniref:hypothetical protein n=1 Tax=Luteibacter sp. UNCMF331Sha3.1 TaxID=1502760 RepID=UPI00049289FD|nr:hypothetical protein [Luteibacter sp. UNCMF331Sha3.1]SEN04099.1 ABC-2 type transport system permease protein [Luteibacter sp. UNCMF331Sha3.1]
MKTFYWLVKREFWETKGGFFWAPIVTGIVFLVLNGMALIVGEVFGRRGGDHWQGFRIGGQGLHADLAPDQVAQIGAGIDIMFYAVASIILCVTAIVVFFYALGSLYDDRRDRSILFWKSLPISDTSTVLSKLASALFVAPAIAVVVGVLVALGMAVIIAIAAALHGVGLWALLMASHPIRVVLNLILLIPLYALWALPTVGWLMLCSAWARSKPFLWAVVLPIAAGVLVSWFDMLGVPGLSSGWFWPNVVLRLFGGLMPGSWLMLGEPSSLAGLDHHDPAALLDGMNLAFHYSTLANPTLWIGVIAGVAMVAGAIWFRRWRDDS